MELKDYFKFIAKWIWLIFAITFFSALIAGIVSYFLLEKEFESSTTIIISSKKTEEQNGRVAFINSSPDKNLIKVYTALAISDTVLDKTISELKLNVKTDDLRDKIKVDPFEDTGIIKIIVKDKSGEKAQNVINSLLNNMQNESDKINLSGSINVIDKAKIPLQPARPKPVLNMFISALAGIMAGIILAIFLESMDDSIKNLKNLRNLYNVLILGTIPKNPKIRKQNNKSKIISTEASKEAYKFLSTRINSLIDNRTLKVILVTSPGSNEGKSAISNSLAENMGRLNKKVLLVDCDFRNEKLFNYLEAMENKGLSDYLADENAKPVITSIPETNINTISKGSKPINPVELLHSEKMTSFIREVREIYDVIIIDSPPVLPVADASVLSKLADGILLVAKFKSTKYEMLSKTFDTLNNLDANILGIVVNQIPQKFI